MVLQPELLQKTIRFELHAATLSIMHSLEVMPLTPSPWRKSKARMLSPIAMSRQAMHIEGILHCKLLSKSICPID